MSFNWCSKLNLEISGSSHGDFIKCSLYGIPGGYNISIDELAEFMKRRAPGQNGTSMRHESDIPLIESGIVNAHTTGGCIKISIKNEDAKSSDYEELRDIPRPGHADFPAYIRSNGGEDLRGGGCFSGRMTVALCAAGGIAIQILEKQGIDIHAELLANERPVPDDDSIGGIVNCRVTGLPIGIGGALFDGLDGKIASLIFSIPAVKGIEFGAGFASATMLGSENNDEYEIINGKIEILSNNAGGILGGMTSGAPLEFRTAFKPTPSIAKAQKSVNLKTMQNVCLEIKGRHDKCLAIRAVPVVEAACAIAVLDCMLCNDGKNDINSARKQIDKIDGQIAALLCRRFELTDSIGMMKSKTGDSVKNEKREAEILSGIATLAGENYAEDFERIYSQILSLSRARQEKIIENVHKKTANCVRNIVIIGMPGSGKSTIGFLLAQKTGREFVDIDTEIYKASGKTPEEIIKLDGEPEFRNIESKLLEQVCTGSGKVISCGGGAILRESNINAMKKNSSVVWLMRDLSLLETCGRPLSEKKGVKELFKTREALYAKAADIRVENNGTIESTVNIILKEIKNEDNCG